MICRPEGPIPARIMIVGEAPGEEEERRGLPFQGVSGHELNRMLGEAGIARSECFITNVCRVRPPGNDINHFFAKGKKDVTKQHTLVRHRWVLPPVLDGLRLLESEISLVQPQVIIALGGTPFWALTGLEGITKWRGSMLFSDRPKGFKVIPTYHPAFVLRQWSVRATAVHDLRRAARFRLPDSSYPTPSRRFILRPTFSQTIRCLDSLLSRLNGTNPSDCGAGAQRELLRLSFDLETRHGHIACAGLSWTLSDAICIPFMCVTNREGYWTLDEEAIIVCLLAQVLTHPNALVVGQNILYDAQYTYHHWGFVPHVTQDCMISQHSIFSDLPKSLAYQASMYCDYYVYWKDEGKNWDKTLGEEQLWHYNCLDCVYTDEVGRVELQTAEKLKLVSVHDFQQSMFWPVLYAMLQGVRIDLEVRRRLTAEVKAEIVRREDFMSAILGYKLNPESPKQMHALFYGDLLQPVIKTRAKKGVPGRPTLDDAALNLIAKREPLLLPLVNAILDIRTMHKFLSNFLEAELDPDNRMRCSYNIGGSESGKSAPKTYRLSSSTNAFGRGANMQTVPSEKSKSLNKAAQRGGVPGLGDPYTYPNIRSMFVPDPGYGFWDGDLDRADLQVVVWEADDAMLKAALRQGVDIHLLNAFVLQNRSVPPLEELVETHAKYLDHRRPLKALREFAKTFCHGTNYLGKPHTMAAHTGWTVRDIERAQKTWFGAHPGIEQWHKRIISQVSRHRFVENAFGYRWYIFDRVDSIMPEAVAWIPQSTVSIVINRIWTNIYQAFGSLDPDVQVLLQVHDSLGGNFRLDVPGLPQRIQALGSIKVPYADPLTIPFSVKTSAESWGACK